jgi:hypothetical protein
MSGLTFTNTKKSIFNRYIVGSGVGSISSSNRAALNKRAYNPQCNNIETDVRYIKVFFRGTDGIIQISQLAAYVNDINIAPNGTPSAANNLAETQTAKNAETRYPIDGTLSTRAYPEIYHSAQPSGFGYWLLDLGQAYKLDRIVYYNRPGYAERAIGMLIETYDKNFNNNSPNDSVALNQFILNSDLIQTFNL